MAGQVDGSHLIHWLPVHLPAVAVAVEAKQGCDLVTIERLDCRQQSLLGFLIGLGNKRIVDELRPTFLFEGSQDEFLVAGGNAEPLDDLTAEEQLAMVRVPFGNFGSCVAIAAV